MASLLVNFVRVFAILNIVLLLGLAYVWVNNYRQLRSKHSLGLVMFAGFLLGENLLVAYFIIIDPTLSAWVTNNGLVTPVAQQAMMVLIVLEFGALLVLSWITWD